MSQLSKMGELKERKYWIFPAERRRVLDELYDLTLLCNKCLYCRFVFAPEASDSRFVIACPRGDVFKHAAYYAEGTIEIARSIIEKRLNWNKTIEQILYTCTDCGHCEYWCSNAMRVYPLTIMEVMKETYVKEHGLPDKWKPVIENLEKTKNQFGRPAEERYKWLPDGVSSPKYADVVLVAGDVYAYKLSNIALAAVNVLKKLGVRFTVLYENEWHSGYLLFRAGLRDKGLEFLKHNIEALSATGVKKVVFLDPHDYRTFKKEALEEGLTYDFEVQHFMEFVLPLLKKAEHRLEKLNIKATYHDPCNLTRHIMPFPVWDQPREILHLIGIEVVEMPRKRLNTYCCGGGGGVPFSYPSLAKIIANKRLEEAKSTGVEVLITSCPSCVWTFTGESGMRVYDIIELIDKALIR